MIIGNKIYHYKSVTSTNTFACRLAKRGKPEGTVLIAEYQSRGMAAAGKTWISPRGKSILLSIILRPRVLPAEASRITRHVAIAVGRAINITTGLQPEFKWPNDLMLKRRKICGILTRMSTKSEQIEFVIVGIGVNVNTEIKSLVNGATSLKIELGKSVNRRRLIKTILKELDKEYHQFKKALTLQNETS